MGCVKKAEKFVEPVADIALAATGNAEFIPLANAGITATEGVANGQSVGKSLGQGAISGGEALAGQELAGAVGIGSGNDEFNSVLGITGDNPAGTGLPDIGGAISSGVSGLEGEASNALGSVENTLGIAGGGTATGGTDVVAPAVSGSGSSLAPGASAAGASVAPTSGAVTSAAAAPAEAAQQIGSQLSVGDIASTAASPGLGSLTSPAAASGAGSAAPTLGGATESSIDSLTAPNSSSFAFGGGNAGSAVASGAGSDSIFSVKNLEKAIPSLGLAGYEAIKGPVKLPAASSALQPGGAVTAPLLATENQQLGEANSGQLTAPQQQTILNFVQGQQNQIIQQLASQGVTDVKNDSRYIQAMQGVQQQALALQQQYISAALTAGTAAAGKAGDALTTVGNQQIQSDTNFQNSLQNALGALGGAFGAGSVNKNGVNINVN